ncbi:hypothetical protein COI88_23420 [Bacillus cereus]|nr:hypothetical protein CN390_06820 [Bacillus cereus]PFJ00786.1 hypothetical protein COI88_23420 [Bacillus cereus]PGU36408.1 hypothetical protein COD66_05580 [Bacillus cereus]
MKENLFYYDKIFLFLMGLAVTSSCIVIVEPAPYDIIIVMIFGLGMAFRRLKFNKSQLEMPFFIVFVFIICNLISMFEIGHIGRGLSYFLVTFYLILSWLAFIGIYGKYGEVTKKIIMFGYTIAALLSATIGTLAYFHVIPFYDKFIKFGRSVALFKDPNVFGPFLIPIILYAVYNIICKVKIQRYVWVCIYIIGTLGVLLSFSRAAWINYVISLSIFLLIWGIRFNKEGIVFKKSIFKVITGITITFVTVIYIALSMEDVSDLFLERFSYQHYDNERFDVQEMALANSLKYPLGVGPGQSEFVLDYATHSLYVRILSENGIIGILVFMIFVIMTLYRAIKNYIKTKDIIYALAFASIIGIMVNSITIDSIHWRHFWLLLAIPWFSKNEVEDR